MSLKNSFAESKELTDKQKPGQACQPTRILFRCYHTISLTEEKRGDKGGGEGHYFYIMRIFGVITSVKKPYFFEYQCFIN